MWDTRLSAWALSLPDPGVLENGDLPVGVFNFGVLPLRLLSPLCTDRGTLGERQLGLFSDPL